MELGKLSKFKFYESAKHWEVDKEYVDPIYNYLVHGLSPGSFFTALLANDAFGAVSRSHPGNTIPALKNLVGWLDDIKLRGTAYGSYETVEQWLKMNSDVRRIVLEARGLVFTPEEETWKTLKEGPVNNYRAPYMEMIMESLNDAQR